MLDINFSRGRQAQSNGEVRYLSLDRAFRPRLNES